MVWIPGGEFLMGTDPEELDRMWERFGWPEDTKRDIESPRHQVRLDGFWMYRTEVTNRQFAQFVQETSYRTEAERFGLGLNVQADGSLQKTIEANWRHPLGPDSSIEGKEDGPVVMVTWPDACAYCLWAGSELPSEAQWEYAARGGDTGLNGRPHRFFVWGDDLPTGEGRYANILDESARQLFPDREVLDGYDDGYPSAAPVGSFQADGFGLYDMAGNVHEWCRDWLNRGFYTECDRQGMVSKPVCSRGMNYRFYRGGSWARPPEAACPARRAAAGPPGRISGMKTCGLRCVRPPGVAADLDEARAALWGSKSDRAGVRPPLLDMVQDDAAARTSTTLFYAYVYLGYIAAASERYAETRSWYKKALEVEHTGHVPVTRKAIEDRLGGKVVRGFFGFQSKHLYHCGRNHEIHVMDADGSEQTNLSNSPDREMHPT